MDPSLKDNNQDLALSFRVKEKSFNLAISLGYDWSKNVSHTSLNSRRWRYAFSFSILRNHGNHPISEMERARMGWNANIGWG